MSLIQTGNMMLLWAIFLSVAPGVPLGPEPILAIGLGAALFYTVDALSGGYDLITSPREEPPA